VAVKSKGWQIATGRLTVGRRFTFRIRDGIRDPGFFTGAMGARIEISILLMQHRAGDELRCHEPARSREPDKAQG